MTSLPQPTAAIALQQASAALVAQKVAKAEIRRLIAAHVAMAAVRKHGSHPKAARALQCHPNTLFRAMREQPSGMSEEVDRLMRAAGDELLAAGTTWQAMRIDFDRALLEEAMRGWNDRRGGRVRAARILGISEGGLNRMRRRTA